MLSAVRLEEFRDRLATIRAQEAARAGKRFATHAIARRTGRASRSGRASQTTGRLAPLGAQTGHLADDRRPPTGHNFADDRAADDVGVTFSQGSVGRDR